MAKPAIAIIVAGTGDTTDTEVFDLLEDAYPEDQYAEIGLIVPVDKDLFSKSVQHAVAWFGDDENVYPVQTKGASLARSATKLGNGNQTVDKFLDIFDAADYKDWDEVHVLLAIPPGEGDDGYDEDEYDLYAEVAEAASEAGFKVRDLTAGLDDVMVLDAEDAAPEPEEEPEKPARRSRRKAADEELPAEEPEEEPEKPAARRSSRAKKAETVEEVQEATKAPDEPAAVETDHLLAGRVESLENRLEEVEDILSRLGMVLAGPAPSEAPAAPEKPAEDDGPKRGRGRPRTDFEIRQVFDEDADDWVPRPKGRLKKGTDWRTIHAETNEVLDEGTA